MQPGYIDLETFRRQQWRKNWPTSLLAIIAVIQMLTTFIIIGFETWSMVIHIKRAFLFVGYSTACSFTITWISTFTVVCCNQESRCCATHALVENILSVIASSILLYYDVQFIREPWKCLWPGGICSDNNWNFTWSTWWNKYNIDTETAKIIAIKGQLSCAAIMLAFCLLYILIYIYTHLKVKAKLATIYPQDTIELSCEQQFTPATSSTWPEHSSIRHLLSKF